MGLFRPLALVWLFSGLTLFDHISIGQVAADVTNLIYQLLAQDMTEQVIREVW
jgi:hypothetical protein